MIESQEPKYDAVDGKLVNRASGEPIPDDEPVFILRAKDSTAADALSYYADMASDDDHCIAVLKRLNDFRAFAKAHPERMKEPDTAKEKN